MPMCPSPKAVGFMHMVATKSFLIGLLNDPSLAVNEVLVGFEGTREEAIQAINDEPREVFAMGCDHYDEKGYCLGHEKSR